MSELPSRSAVLPAELKVLELGLLIALLGDEEGEEGALGYRCPETNGEHKYLAETGSVLRRAGLVHRRGLLTACLSAIVVVAEAGESKGICQSPDAGTSGECTHTRTSTSGDNTAGKSLSPG